MTVAGRTTFDFFTFAFCSSYDGGGGDWWWWRRRMSEYFSYPRLHKTDSQFLTSHYLNHSLWHDAALLFLLPQHLGGNKRCLRLKTPPSNPPHSPTPTLGRREWVGKPGGGARVDRRRRGARCYGWVERKWKVRKYLNGRSGMSK